jgi:hypothetical protein
LQVTEQQRSRSGENNELTTSEELELFIQYQLEQERQDQHDLNLFYEMKNEEANAEKARRFYNIVLNLLHFLVSVVLLPSDLITPRSNVLLASHF